MADAKIISKAELKSKDFVPRGKKSSSPVNTTLFLGLRVFDCLLQYQILSKAYGTSLINFFGGDVIPSPEPLNAALGLSAYRLVLLAMLCTTTAKHIWFVTCVIQEAWTVQ
jgi:hypothetical protein